MTKTSNVTSEPKTNTGTHARASFSAYLITLGCDKNRVDGEVMLGKLVGTQLFTPVDDPATADIIIVNTCGFIREATQESIDMILEMAAYRSDPDTPCRALIVVGCMSERYREETKTEIPEADAILGVKDANTILEVLSRLLEIDTPHTSSDIGANRAASSPYIHDRHVAHIKIADGCNNACAYCTIPSIRGPYKSRPMEDILQECKLLIAAGAKELVIIAQDTTQYGTDIYGSPSLHKLLRAVAELDNDIWVRLMYAYPEHITPDIIATMADLPNICKYIDMPIQHSETSVLKRMGRTGTKEDLLALISSLRDKVPDIALRTTLMVGFPGETVEDYRGLYNFAKEVKFDRLGAFPYSREEGTPAASLPQQVKETVKHSRRDRLMRLQQKIHQEKQLAKIGQIINVMIDTAAPYATGDLSQAGESNEYNPMIPGGYGYIGRTQHDAYEVDAIVRFTSDSRHKPGDIVKVKITGADEYDLMGVKR